MAANLDLLREEMEDVKLELEITIVQLNSYEKMSYGRLRPKRTRVAIQENVCQSNDRDPAAHRVECEISNLREKLAEVKSRLGVYQAKECELLRVRRQVALAEHRREYERRHPGCTSHLQTDVDSDSDYDTID